MPQGNPKTGERYIHFKGNLYQVVTTAEHSESGETLVIYQALYPPFQIYARPLEQFISHVDTDKYPDAGQFYRFQLENAQPEKENPDSGSRLEADQAKHQNMAASLANASAEEKLMAFFDADTMEKRYQILLEMRDVITDRMINNMAVVLDVVIDEGSLDQRYEELKTCIRTFQRYEIHRLR